MRNWREPESEYDGSSSDSGWSIDREEIQHRKADPDLSDEGQLGQEGEIWDEVREEIVPGDVERGYDSEEIDIDSPKGEEDPLNIESDQASSASSTISRTPSEIREAAVLQAVSDTVKAMGSTMAFLGAIAVEGTWWLVKYGAKSGRSAAVQCWRRVRRGRNMPYIPLVRFCERI
jgi:hypothetical protein